MNPVSPRGEGRRRGPRRSVELLVLVVGMLAFTAAASPLVWAALGGLGWDVTFSRVYNRVFEIGIALGVLAAWRPLDLGRPRDWGFRARGAWRGFAVGLAIGATAIAVALLIAWLGGGVVLRPRYDALKTVWKSAAGLAGALVVGVGEEALFRGLLIRRLCRDFGTRAGGVVVTVVYAIVHALRGAGVRGPVDAWSGVRHTLALGAPLLEPANWPGVLALAGFGAVLLAARWWGSLWMAAGIHASWVAVFRVGRLFLHVRHRPQWLVGSGWPPLVGGAAGWAAIAVLAVLAHRVTRRPSSQASEGAGA